MKTITVYEHERLSLSTKSFTKVDLDTLGKFHDKEDRFFSLEHKGVKFKHLVGLFRVGNLQIEVLPKISNGNKEFSEEVWRTFLLDILVRSKILNVHLIDSSQTKLKDNLLDYLLNYYLKEVDTLLQQGLIKRYRRNEGNILALKGKLLFSQQIKHNLVHQERFYTAHTKYDFDHALNQLISAAICTIPKITNSQTIKGKANQLSLLFPEVTEIGNPTLLRQKIKRDRKTAPFSKAIELADLIVNNYHPNLSSGQQESFSLMFDMNRVFEEWLRVELRAAGQIDSTRNLAFLRRANDTILSSKPDIIIKDANGNEHILDAKWKHVETINEVSQADMRQVYTYLNLVKAGKTAALVYPTLSDTAQVEKHMFLNNNGSDHMPFYLVHVPIVNRNGKLLKEEAGEWMNLIINAKAHLISSE